MMRFFDFLSSFLIPFVVFYIVAYGFFQKKSVFEEFIAGGKRGFLIVAEIAPTIVGLIVAVGVLRVSGTLDLFCALLQPVAGLIHIPVDLLPVSIVKLFSASGANGLLFDLFKQYGTDSQVGLTASILLSCTETLFYTISVYCMSIGVHKTRWLVPAGLIIAGISLLISVQLTNWMF